MDDPRLFFCQTVVATSSRPSCRASTLFRKGIYIKGDYAPSKRIKGNPARGPI